MYLPVVPDIFFITLFYFAVCQSDLNNPWLIRMYQQTKEGRSYRLPNFFSIVCADPTLRTAFTFCHIIGYRSPLMAVTALKGRFSKLVSDMPYKGNTASCKSFVHPSRICMNMIWQRPRWRPYPRFLCCVQTRLYPFPFHFFNFNSSSRRYVCERHCSPKNRFGPNRIRDGNVCLEFPFLTSLFDDLARVFLVVAIVLGQSFLGVTGSLSDLVKVRIGRVH